MSAILYAASTGGFYDTRIHTAIPGDAVAISAASFARLMRAQASGGVIVARRGRPAIERPAPSGPARYGIAQLRARAIAAIDAAARSRILAIASLARQSNDNAALAIAAIVGTLSEEAAAALDRRTRIEAIRKAAAAARTTIASADRATLDMFSAEAPGLWPVETQP